MLKINKSKTATALVLSLIFSASTAQARLYIDYEGAPAGSLKQEDPRTPIATDAGSQDPRRKSLEPQKPKTTDRAGQAAAVTTAAPMTDSAPVTVVSPAPGPHQGDKPGAQERNAHASDGVVVVGTPQNISRTSSGGSLKIDQAMMLISPPGWTVSYKGNLDKAPRVTWDVKNASLQEVLTDVHKKTGVGFMIDWDKKNIEVHGA